MSYWDKDQDVKCNYRYIVSRVHSINMIYNADVDHDHIAEVVLVKFLHCKVNLFFPPAFHVEFFGSKFTICSPHQGVKSYTSLLFLLKFLFSNLLFQKNNGFLCVYFISGNNTDCVGLLVDSFEFSRSASNLFSSISFYR